MVDVLLASKLLVDSARQLLAKLDGRVPGHEDPGRQFERLRRVVRVLFYFTSETPLEPVEGGGEIPYRPFTRFVDESEVQRLSVLVQALQQAMDDSHRPLGYLIDTRRQLTAKLASAIETARSEIAPRFGEEASRVLSELAMDLASVTALDAMDDLAAAAEAKTALQETAGDLAESELAKEFAGYGDLQQRTGYAWLVAAIALFGVALVVGAMLLRQTGQAFDWYSFATRLLIALPCFGLAAYCARESSRHRELAQWARRIAVQLKSVGAYTARLDDVSRLSLLSQFGSYVFGPHHPGRDDNQIQPIPPELWKALADVIRSRGDARA